MAEGLFRRTITGLAPDDEDAATLIRKVPVGTVLRVEWKRPRNVAWHRKFMKLVDTVFHNQSRYKSKEAMLFALKIWLGHCETVETRNGPMAMPLSISFHKLDQDGFEDLWDRCVKFFCEEVIPLLDESDLKREIEGLVA